VSRIKNEFRPLSAEELEAKHHAVAEWECRVAELRQVVAQVIPKGARVVVADEEQHRNALAGTHSIPFLERNGLYWGSPGSAEESIRETWRQVQQGANWLIIAWPMFWALEKYPAFLNHLRENFQCRYDSAVARIFQLERLRRSTETSVGAVAAANVLRPKHPVDAPGPCPHTARACNSRRKF